ncbi:uncharacterized protein F4817DRAFT_323051 [Daldinia loculata]|uniref:uncharacterized protein n=1 Tax=Daldinia loculata TaxID=103429 RepID=UPI0020C52B97|nr:uncharacterized protein F4817DRAFT_323051 [Daldinia loculata]KAI1652347.1 hypothetical protein F4817DRAFT_323051 [Daldinia loculata]
MAFYSMKSLGFSLFAFPTFSLGPFGLTLNFPSGVKATRGDTLLARHLLNVLLCYVVTILSLLCIG